MASTSTTDFSNLIDPRDHRQSPPGPALYRAIHWIPAHSMVEMGYWVMGPCTDKGVQPARQLTNGGRISWRK